MIKIYAKTGKQSLDKYLFTTTHEAYKIDNLSIPNNYLHITSSNKIEAPNGHILFEKEQKTLFYRNVKTNETYSKNIANLQFIKHFGKIYTIYEMYKEIYKEDLTNLNNPTSH